MFKLLNGILIAVLTLSFFSVTTFAQNKSYDVINGFGLRIFSKKTIEEPDLSLAIWHANQEDLVNNYEIRKTKYYDVNYKDYQNDLNTVFEKSKSRNEFETPEEYEARLFDAMSLKKSIDEKYNDLLLGLVNNDIEIQNTKVQQESSVMQDKINQSIEPIETKIATVGTYDINNEILPITINGVTENLKIKRGEAKNLKENFGSAVVIGKKRLKYDLKTYEFFEPLIIHPIISKLEYKFGNW